MKQILKKEELKRQKEIDKSMLNSNGGIKIFQDYWEATFLTAKKICETKEFKSKNFFKLRDYEDRNSFKIFCKQHYLSFDILFQGQNSADGIDIGIKLCQTDYSIPTGFIEIENYHYTFTINNWEPYYRKSNYNYKIEDLLTKDEILEKHLRDLLKRELGKSL